MDELDELVFCFQGKTSRKALSSWVDDQISAYPQREEEIKTVQLAMFDFMKSNHVKNHKMVVESLAKKVE